MSIREDLKQFSPEAILAFKRYYGVDLYALAENEEKAQLNKSPVMNGDLCRSGVFIRAVANEPSNEAAIRGIA